MSLILPLRGSQEGAPLIVVLLLIIVSLLLFVAVRVGVASEGGAPLVSLNRLLLLLAVGLLIVIIVRVFHLPAGRSPAPAPVAASTATPLSAPSAVPSTPATSSPASLPSPSPSFTPATRGQVVPSQMPPSTDIPPDTPSSTPESSVTPAPFGSDGAGSPPAGCWCPPATAAAAAPQFGGNPENWSRQDFRGVSWTYRSAGWVPLRFVVPAHSVVDLQQGRVFPGGVVTTADFTISWSADDSGR